MTRRKFSDQVTHQVFQPTQHCQITCVHYGDGDGGGGDGDDGHGDGGDSSDDGGGEDDGDYLSQGYYCCDETL